MAPNFSGFDCHFLAERAGNKDERQIGALVHGKLQSGKAVERRKLVVREDDIDVSVFQSGHELGASLDAGDFAERNVSASRSSLNELGVAWGRPPATECGEETSQYLFHAARRRFIDHRPEDTQFLHGIDKLVKVDRLHDIGVHPELVASHHVFFLVG